jgi:hypothetical protein
MIFGDDKHCLDVCAASRDEFQKGRLRASPNEVRGEGEVAGISADDFEILCSSERRLSTRRQKIAEGSQPMALQDASCS